MKQMWDKKKLEEMIQEGGSSITVDDQFSTESENPVQNKVITNALLDASTELNNKQDKLPDTAGQTGKFLKVGSEGLEWGEVGGKYLHEYEIIFNPGNSPYAMTARFYIVANKNTALTNEEIVSYISSHYSNDNRLTLIVQDGTYLKNDTGELVYLRNIGGFASGTSLAISGQTIKLVIDSNNKFALGNTGSISQLVNSFTFIASQVL